MSEPRSQRGTSRDAAAGKASPKVNRARVGRSTTKRSRDASAPASPRSAPVGFVCPPCGRFIPIEVDGLVLRSRAGSPPRFCSAGCRQAGVAEDVALQLRGGRDRSLGGAKGGRR